MTAPKVGWLLNAPETLPEAKPVAVQVFDLQVGDKKIAAMKVGTEEFKSWDWWNDGGYFKPKELRSDTEPRGYAIRAIKTELEALDFDKGPVPMVDNGFYGSNMIPSVMAFQSAVGLEPDGVVGPRTVKKLSHNRIVGFQSASEHRVEIPNDLTCKAIDLESGWYLACRNTTNDFGEGQIHDPLNQKFADGSYICPKRDKHGNLILEEDRWVYAYRVGTNVRYVAEQQRRNFKHCEGIAPSTMLAEDIWKAAIFAYNAPAWADDWLRAGFPSSGGGTVTVGGWTGDKFEWATLYVKAVYSRAGLTT